MQTIDAYLGEQNIDFQTSADGIRYAVDQAGEGQTVNERDYVKVHYTGKLLNGEVFDSSVTRGEPFTFQVGIGHVIQGWDKGIPLFKTGGKGTLYLSPDQGYGSRGSGSIPPNSPLIFEIEVLGVLDEAAYKKEQEERVQVYIREMMAKDHETISKYADEKGLTYEVTENGLAYIVEAPGTGKQAIAGEKVTVHYHGTLLSGQKFDSSFDRGTPFSFQLGAGQVIQGWDEGIALFKEGGKGTLLIPSLMGYGHRGAGGTIPPNSVLRFDIELVKVG
ncbi:MAG: FKBP-type peptidyl-prolyl cis-trans isomerase [Bacteroidota bacterium]